ncbi:hypothetical protein SUGI_0891310 [Cryptomeria japonica]|uniref:nuclear speckle RNA-binding protein A n=1 Tax=Cryptomeria japonica TaxID=3369 RepID=UPI002414B988|nr:nuclear speckle RNA-binding protein A [Cryptomeria japonica]GLJ42951.1 hypothetical protein SUGI_0891310 [Cryptomeria japonica]
MSRFGGEIDASFSGMASSFKRPRTDYEYAGVELGLNDYYREIPSQEYVTRDRILPALYLPPDASSTLFVKGLPTDCSRREVAHIFRPFRGFKDVRLVSKDFPRGDTLVFCFVEFESPTFAATAMEALQGYKLDGNDRNSPVLEVEFGRSSSGERGRRGMRRRSDSPPFYRRR